jgi:hypothetical protein
MEHGKIEKIKKYVKLSLPALLGIIGGYAYYYYVGCNRGCAITGNPYTSMIWGGVIGLLLTNFKGNKKSEEVK